MKKINKLFSKKKSVKNDDKSKNKQENEEK